MFRMLSSFTSYKFANLRSSLKLLEIQIPTNKAVIKKQYLLMAKKYHPDTNEELIKANSKEKKEQIHQRLEEKFIAISKAYQYLKDLSEEDINSLRERSAVNNPSDSSDKKQDNYERKRKMTMEEVARKQAYDYFNSNYKNFHPEQKTVDLKDKKSLIRSVPELFVGILLLTMILGDYSYRVYQSKKTEEIITYTDSRNELKFEKVFKKMNFKERLYKEQQKMGQNEIIE